MLIPLTAFCVLAVLGSGATASAATANCGSHGHYFDGYGDWSSGYIGTSATIVVRNSPLCSTDTNPESNFSFTWVMIADNDGSSGYAQSGYFHGYGTPIRLAVEDSPSGTTFRRTYVGTATVGAAYDFSVQSGSGTNCPSVVTHCELEMIDGVIYQSTGFDPAKRWTAPFSNEWLGETTWTNSDISGTSANKSAFTNLDVEDTIDGFIGHAYTNGSASPVNPRGQRSAWSSTSFSIWSS